MKVLTRDLLLKGRSVREGWTKAQLTIIGIAWPLKRGWMRQVIGKRISEESLQLFLRNAPSIPREELESGLIREIYRQPSPQGSWVYVDFDHILEQTKTALHIKFAGRRQGYWIPKADVAWWEAYEPKNRDGTIWIRRGLAAELNLA